jgi:hypothetical protein
MSDHCKKKCSCEQVATDKPDLGTPDFLAALQELQAAIEKCAEGYEAVMVMQGNFQHAGSLIVLMAQTGGPEVRLPKGEPSISRESLQTMLKAAWMMGATSLIEGVSGNFAPLEEVAAQGITTGEHLSTVDGKALFGVGNIPEC